MNNRSVLGAVAVAAVILAVGCIFVDENPWLGYVESAIVYLAAVIGGCCYWLVYWLGGSRGK